MLARTARMNDSARLNTPSDLTLTDHPQIDRSADRTSAIESTDGTADTPTFELSVRQLFASAMAAVTAALLGSRLGVAGTLVGAALGSATTMIASAVYSHSLATARYRVRMARHTTLPTSPGADSAATTALPGPEERAWGYLGDSGVGTALPPAIPTTVRAAPDLGRAWSASTTPRPYLPTSTPYPLAMHGLAGMPAAVAVPAPVKRRRPKALVMLTGAIAGFALALIAVTAFEAVSGSPISGGASGGLSVLGGTSNGGAHVSPSTSSSSVNIDTAAGR